MPLDPSERSDWSELDLLTVAEATTRLDEETALVRRLLAEHPDDPALRHRLTLLARARERATQPTATIPTGPLRTLAEIADTPGPPD